MLELKADEKRQSFGTVVEAKLDKGRGPVTTLLVQEGELQRGDIVCVGAEWGKVRDLLNDQGDQVKVAGPSLPVEILGLNGVPEPGDQFAVVAHEARAREVAAEMLSCDPAALGAARALLNAEHSQRLAAAMQEERAASAALREARMA